MEQLRFNQMEKTKGGTLCETSTILIWMGGSIGFITQETCPTFPLTTLDF